MRHAASEANQFTLMKNRHRESKVIQMTACGVGIIGDHDVAWVNVFIPKMPDFRFDRFRHTSNEHWQT